MIRHSAILSVALGMLLARGAMGGTWIMENDALKVEFDDQQAAFQVTGKASGAVWKQAPSISAYKAGGVEKTDNQLSFRLEGAVNLRANLSFTPEGDLALAVEADPGVSIGQIHYPGPFITPTAEHNLVFTDSEGYLVPCGRPFGMKEDQVFTFWGMGGLIMTWVGVVDPALESGYMMILDTADDAGVRIAMPEGRAAPAPVWLGSKGEFAYPRRVLYHFFDKGGYVAQAKHYREYVQRTREFSTLRARAARKPAVEKLIGAVQIYTWDNGRTLELARELKAAGIEKAWVGWDPSHPPYPQPGYDNGLKELGYLAGVYDLYRDMYDDKEWEGLWEKRPELKELWLHRYYYPGLFPEIVPRGADGQLMRVSFNPNYSLWRYWTCDRAILPHVHERTDKELKVYPHDSIFLDVTLAAPPYECYDETHPMTRAESREDRIALLKMFDEDLKVVVGSEWGADYGVAHSEFMHGLMTLHRFYEDKDYPPHTRGDWMNLARPTEMIGENVPSVPYQAYALGERYRVPLYELVYHDCTVTSWRWEDNSHKKPSAWDKKDLFNALYGNAIQWNLTRDNWDEYKEKFTASYKEIGPWLQKIGWDEMVDHRFLTEDRSVQESRFSSGWAGVVNFSLDTTYVLPDGQTVAPFSFASYRWNAE